MSQPEKLECSSPELAETDQSTINSLIPTKSKKLYEFAYQRFLKWAQEHNATKVNEHVLLLYFETLAKTMKSSTLWAQYSMIKAELNLKKGEKIEHYTKLYSFLRSQGEGYTPKKANIFTSDQLDTFLREAPDETYLAMKVIMLFGVTGACRCDELVNININDIEDCNTRIIVNIPNSKTKKARLFAIVDDFHIMLYRKYAMLRPDNTETSRFFIKYLNGKCHRTVMGIHKISSTPREVALYLKLPHLSEYTGHSLRRTSATLLTDDGGNLSNFKRKSSTVNEEYVQNSQKQQTETALRNPNETEPLPLQQDATNNVNTVPLKNIVCKEEEPEYEEDISEIAPLDTSNIVLKTESDTITYSNRSKNVAATSNGVVQHSLFLAIVSVKHEILRPNWTVHYDDVAEVLIFTSCTYVKLQLILKQIIIDSRSNVVVKICGKEIPSLRLPKSFDEFMPFFAEIDALRVCAGCLFYDGFKNTRFKSTENMYNIKRHKKCPIIIPRGESCLKCSALKNVLFQSHDKKKRKKIDHLNNFSSKYIHIKHRTMQPTRLKRKIFYIKKQIKQQRLDFAKIKNKTTQI